MWEFKMSDDELELIKSRKLLQMMKETAKKITAEQQKSVKEDIEKSKERFFSVVLTDEARRYLAKIKAAKPTVAEKIENAIVYIFANGLINRRLTEIDIMKMERKIEGVEPKIMVKRRGERAPVDLSDALKQD